MTDECSACPAVTILRVRMEDLERRMDEALRRSDALLQVLVTEVREHGHIVGKQQVSLGRLTDTATVQSLSLERMSLALERISQEVGRGDR